MLVQGMNFYSDEKKQPHNSTASGDWEWLCKEAGLYIKKLNKKNKKNKGVNITVFIAHGREFGSLHFT